MGPGTVPPPYGGPPFVRPPVRTRRRAASPAGAIVSTAVIVVVLFGVAGGAYLFLSRGKARFCATWELETIDAFGMTINVKEFGRTLGGIAGALGGAPSSIEARLILRRDGTGEITGGGMGMAGGPASDSSKVKWTYKDGKAEVRFADDASAPPIVCELTDGGKGMKGTVKAAGLGTDIGMTFTRAKK